MSTISSKQVKRHSLVNPIPILFLLVLVLALLVFAPFTGNTYDSISSALGAPGNASSGLSANAEASFALDQQYWNTNCSHGWSSDSTCDGIVLRAQSCSISVNSAYCSEYNNYLQQFRD